MQKISSYLYSNRIQTVVNLASSPLEWRIVYQRKVKIYQGLDNVIEFDIKNSEQKRLDITGFNMKLVIMDQNDQQIHEATLDVNTGIKGIARATIPPSAIAAYTPQFLKYTLYKINSNGTRTPVYGDTQFGVSGTIDLLDGAMPKAIPPKVIDTFIYYDDTTDLHNIVRTYLSEAIEIRPLNFGPDNSQVRLEFWPVSMSATVTVQITDDAVVSSATIWKDVETFSIAPSTDRVYKTYNEVVDYSNNVSWVRIKYVNETNNTGIFDKVLVRV
jgi:hypothetical protein